MVKEIKEGYLGLMICRSAPSTGSSPSRSWWMDLIYTVDLPPACLVFPSDEMGEGGDGVGGVHGRWIHGKRERKCGDGGRRRWGRGPWIWIGVEEGRGGRENVMRGDKGEREVWCT